MNFFSKNLRAFGKNFQKEQLFFSKGFSLVELAMSLLVIGLILGGVLKGKELVEQAKLQKTVVQISSYQTAYLTFKEHYGAPPGDFSRASLYWGDGVRNGGGNGFIEGKGLDVESEAGLFWHHLLLAGLVTFAVPSSDERKMWNPVSPLGGKMSVEESPEDLEGVWLILGGQSGQRTRGGLLTPAQAAFLNRKMDNGDPLSGNVQSREGEGHQKGRCILNGQYNVGVNDKTCVLYVRLD